MYKAFAGIGSRKTPDDVLPAIIDLCKILVDKNYILRSGGASGADSMFEHAYDLFKGNKEIYLPYKNYNCNNSSLYDIPEKAYEITKKYHPAWDKLPRWAKNLHARNAQQIFGKDIDSPCEFVICWTQDGCSHHNNRNINTGGTGQAISIASLNGIKVYNLKNKFDQYLLYTFLTT